MVMLPNDPGQSARFMRIIIEAEFEVIDPISAAAYTTDYGTDGEGQIGMIDFGGDQTKVANAIMQTIGDALQEHGPARGFRWMGSSHFLRSVEDGQHPELPMGAMPARRDDGTYDH